MVVPALTALLSDAAWEVLGNHGPLLWSIDVDELLELLVLLFGPGPLVEFRVQDLLPAV